MHIKIFVCMVLLLSVLWYLLIPFFKWVGEKCNTEYKNFIKELDKKEEQ